MNTSILTFPVDSQIIKKAEKNADKLGISLQDLLKTMTDKWLKDFADTKDEDTLRIKASALRNDLSEEEAAETIDKIRKNLPMNKI